METIEFKIVGKIKGKQRPRVSTFGGFARAYTPKETIEYENLVRLSFLEQYPNFIPYDAKKPLKVVLKCFKAIPQTFSKWKKELALDKIIRPTVKPDLDNIAKSVLDGLNKVAFSDDSQIVDLHIESYYSNTELIIVSIQEIDQPQTSDEAKAYKNKLYNM